MQKESTKRRCKKPECREDQETLRGKERPREKKSKEAGYMTVRRRTRYILKILCRSVQYSKHNKEKETNLPHALKTTNALLFIVRL